MTVNNEFNDSLPYMHLNPARKGLVARSKEWRWPSCNNFSRKRGAVEACPIQIDYVHLPEQHRG
jgi:hypothetical protein